MKHFLLLLSTFLFMISCSTKTSQTDKKETIPNLSGKVYMVAPEIDTTDCHAYAECDCCSGNMIFLNDSVFVSVGYCIGNDLYQKGKYKIKENTVLFLSDSLIIHKETNWEKETDTIHKDLPDHFIKVSKEKPVSFKWTKFECKEMIVFKTGEKEVPYASVDIENKFSDLIKELKKDSIWMKLELE